MEWEGMPAICGDTQIPSATPQPISGTIQPRNRMSQWGRAMIDVSPLQLRVEARADGEKLLRYPADDTSSHEYEVKRVHMDGATFDAVVFYLRTGEPVNINVEDVLRKINLWTEPGQSCPGSEPHVIFEVAPGQDGEPVDIYIGRFDAELEQSKP